MKSFQLLKTVFFHQYVEFIALKYGIKPAVLLDFPGALKGKRGFLLRQLCKIYQWKIIPRNLSAEQRQLLSRHRLLFPQYFIVSSGVFKRLSKEFQRASDPRSCGKALGIPECCIVKFCNSPDKNDVLAHLNLKNNAVFDYRINPFLHRFANTYLISYFPCSRRCRESIRYASKVLAAVKKEDPNFAREIITSLKNPILYWREQNEEAFTLHPLKIIIFNGRVKNNIIKYSGFQFFGWNAEDIPGLPLNLGNEVATSAKEIRISKNGRLIKIIKKKEELAGALIKFL